MSNNKKASKPIKGWFFINGVQVSEEEYRRAVASQKKGKA